MARSFATPAAFKASLEARLKSEAAERGIAINTLRLKLVIERLLARLFATPNPPWLLKGGYAMELRYRPRPRTTRDIDLSCSSSAPTLAERSAAIRDQLQDAAEVETGDYLSYRIASSSSELTGAPLEGARFPCEAFLAGKTYGRVHIDLGFGDEPGVAPETLVGDDLLAFADIRPPHVPAIPKSQQFAEKIHAYTFPLDGPGEHADQGPRGPGAPDRNGRRRSGRRQTRHCGHIRQTTFTRNFTVAAQATGAVDEGFCGTGG